MCYCPTPTLHLNLALTGDGAFLLSPQKTLTVWFISILNYGDTENVLINHLLLVIPMSYPCHYTNLCPHKPHKHAHTHTHTHREHTPGAVLHPSTTLKYKHRSSLLAQFCDFVVWAEKDCAVVRVLPDADYWTTLLKRAEEFFHIVSLPELLSYYYTRQASTKTPVSTKLQPQR